MSTAQAATAPVHGGRSVARGWAKRGALPLADTAALGAVAAAGSLPVWAAAAYVLAGLGLLAGQGLHRRRICLRVSDQAPRLAAAGALPLVALLPLQRFGAVALAALAAVLLVGARLAVRAAMRSAHRRGHLVESALLVGAGPGARQVARLLDEHPEFGVRVRGFADRGATGFDPSRLPELAAEVDRVLVCFPDVDEDELVDRLRRCRGAEIAVVPRLSELGMDVPRSRLDEIWGVPLVPLRRSGAGAAVAKRGFDLVVGSVLAVLAAPVVLVLAAVVRVRGGVAFFRQLRVTRARRTAQMVKLRTVPRGDGERWHVGPEQCTRLGRSLRRTHLDELPQLLNVLRGEMSLVGPRPERPYYAMRFEREIPHYDDRHRVRGGMTGWAQVHGLHGDTSIPDRARFDNQYVEYWSPWMDVVVLVRTAAIVVADLVRAPAAALVGAARAGPVPRTTAEGTPNADAGGERREGSARDHGTGSGRSRAAAALAAPAHQARGRGPGALQPR
jgi:lipopolysaccharide/colanic/teichoic acid biosynthesis glycosyltransferase